MGISYRRQGKYIYINEKICLTIVVPLKNLSPLSTNFQFCSNMIWGSVLFLLYLFNVLSKILVLKIKSFNIGGKGRGERWELRGEHV